MQSIFYGILLSFLNFNFNIGESKIGLIPDFLGYIFMFKGVEELAMESDKFTKVKLHIKLMIGYTLFVYIMDLLGISGQINQIFNMMLGIIFAIIALYITYNIVRGIADIEERYNYNLKSDKLYFLWKARVIFTVLVYITTFISELVLIIIIIGFIINVYFIVELYNSKNLYYELKLNN